MTPAANGIVCVSMYELRELRRAIGLGQREFASHQEDGMAVTPQRNPGMLLLAIWLILYGLAGMITLVLPTPLIAVLALLAGILILIDR